VEVLHPKEFQREHLPGAINLPLRQIDRETTAQLDPNRAIVVYCYDYQ
jgi:rhodanese-related sulfurtransferase